MSTQGSKTIDEKVVQMRFDNSNFEKNVKTTMSTLDKLKARLNLTGATKGLEEVQKSANHLSFANVENSLTSLERRFSTMGIVGMTVIQNLTSSLMGYVGRLSNFVTGGIIQGGFNRARNLENARFQLKGLLKDASAVEAVMKDVNYGVEDTAYTLDAAANVAAQLAASGMRAGDGMRTALRGISGVAAMTNSTYEEIGNVYTTVAGNGRLMGEQLLQLSTRGMNAAATLGKYLNKSESEVRDMVSKGKISFEIFAAAMDDAFGAHAKEANKTLQGVTANIRAALAKVGAEFINPIIANEGPLVGFLNGVREKINEMKLILIPLAQVLSTKVSGVLLKLGDAVKKIDLTGVKSFVDKLIEFLKETKTNKKTMQNLKDTLKGFVSILSIVYNLIKSIVSGVGVLLKNLTPLGQGILFITSALGRFLSKTNESIKKSNIFTKVIEKVTTTLQTAINKIKIFVKETVTLDSMIHFFKTIFEGIIKLGIAIGKVFADIIRNGDLKSVIEMINTGLFGGILVGLNRFIHNLSGTTKSATKFFQSITNILIQVKNVFKAWQNELNSKALLNIAKAIMIIVASLYVLSSIDEERLSASLGALTVVMTEMIGMFAIFTNITKKAKNVTRSSVLLLSLSTSLLIIAAAMKKLSEIDSNQMKIAIVGMAAAMTALVLAFNGIPNPNKKETPKKIKGLIAMSISLYIMASAIKKMGSMDYNTLIKGLIGVGLLLTMMINTINHLNSDGAIKKSMSLLIMSNSMIILAGSLKILATMSWSEIARGLTAMGGAFTILTITMNALSHIRGAIGKSFALFGAVTSIIVLAGSLKILATMNWSEIGRALTAMGGSLFILIAALKILGSNFKTAVIGAGSLIIIANALVVLGLGMKILGSLSWESVIKALVTLGGALAILGVGASLLQPLIPALLGVAGAAALFGVAAVTLGLGLGLIATGISALSLALSGGATAIVAGLGAIIIGVAELIPQLISITGEAITALIKKVFVKIVKECLPIITDTLVKGLYDILKSLSTYLPLIVDVVMDILIGVLRGVADRLPELVVAAVELLDAFFRGFVEALKILDPKSLLTGIAAIGMLATILYLMAGLAAIVPEALIGVIAFGVLVTELALVVAAIGRLSEMPGINELVGSGGTLLMNLGTAIGKFIGGIIGGVAAGVSNSLPDIATNLSKFMENLHPFIYGVNAMEDGAVGKIAILSAAIVAISTANFLASIANLLSIGQSLPSLGTQLSQFMKNVTPFVDGANGISPAMLKSVDSLAKAIIILSATNVINGISSWIMGGNSFTKFGENIIILGESMKRFAKNLGTFSDAQVDSIQSACKAISVLAKVSNELPNEGGLLAGIVGDNSIGTFSGYLPELGKNMANFVKNLGTFSEGQVATVTCVASAITELAKASKNIPNEGGMWGWLVGDNTLGTFSQYLPELGKNLGEFAKKLGTFTDAQVNTVKCAATAIAELAIAAEKIPNSGGLAALFMGDNDISKFAGKLPGVGKSLGEFIKSVGIFDNKSIESAKTAANMIVELAKAADKIPNSGGLVKLFVGDNDISKFGEKLPIVGRFLSEFINNVSGFEPSQVSSAETAAKILVSLAKAADEIPTTGGIGKLFTGVTDLEGFSNKMPAMAKGIRDFVTNLEGFDESKLPLVDAASKAILTLAKAADELPPSGFSVEAFFSGTKDIESFSTKLPKVGEGLSKFIEAIGSDFNDQKVATVNCASQAILTLAKASSEIPTGTWSLSKLLGGEKDISAFAEKLPLLGVGIKGFVNKIGTLSEEQVVSVEIATKLIKALSKLTEINADNIIKVMDKINDKLIIFATNLNSFIVEISSVKNESVETAVKNVNSILSLLTNVSKIDVGSLNEFCKLLSNIGKSGFKEFIKAFDGEEPKTKVARAIRDLFDKMITSTEIKRSDLSNKFKSIGESAIKAISGTSMKDKMYNAGKHFAQGFANGINKNSYLASNAGTNLGNAAYKAAKRAIDAHSPSKKAHKLGNYFGQGFIIGINEYASTAYKESYEMANQAKRGLTGAIATINNMLDNSMDTQPTIRPILDLADITAGTSAMARMFDNMNVEGNLNAINKGMNLKLQNGVNDDVVSAINKLGNNISGGDTYNINGITYDDQSAISDAVQTLIRAAIVERRV